MNSRYRFSVDNEDQDGRNDFSNTLEFDATTDRKSTRLNSSHVSESRMPSSA